MIIKNVHISGFGQFHNRDFSFRPGINLISGHNESGKSTLNNFILHMLYGMNRGRGKASRTDAYSKYCPWDYPDSFGGSMRIEADSADYLIERNFSASGKAFTIANETTGEIINGDEAFLNKLTGGISENAFNCTLNIKESGFNGSNDISELVKKNILNIGCTSSVNINVPLALKDLNSRKKKLISEMNNEARKSYYDVEDKLVSLKTELDKKQNEIAKLSADTNSNAAELEQKNRKLSMENEKLQLEYEELKKSIGAKSKNSIPDAKADITNIPLIFKDIIYGSAFSICFIISIICFVLNFKIGGMLFIIAAAAAGIFTACSIAKRLPAPHTYISEFTKLAELKERIEVNKNTLSANIDILLEIKNNSPQNSKLYWECDNLQQQIDSLEEEKSRLELILNENLKLKKEIDALELAVNTIKNISADMHTEHAPELNRKVTQTFNQITQKSRGELFISENMDIILNDGIRTTPAEALSQGTTEQIYMSLRLSAADMLYGKKEFPLIFDEAFSKYDNPRLAQTLKYIHLNHNGQTFIFSCQNRERLILEKLGIPFNSIKL